MAAIILPEKWRRQPTYSVKLDLTNPLSRGIVFAGDGFQRDVVTGRKLTPGPGATNLLVPDNMRRYGAGYKYQFAPGNGQGAFTHTLDTPIQNSVATLALLYSGGANDGNSLLSLNRADSTTGAVRFICSGDRIQAGSINASTSNQTPGDNTTAGDWPAAVATFNGIAYREVTTLKGTYTGSVSIDPGADLSRVVLGNIYISGALTWGASGGAIACPVVWNRVISDAETREYIRAPWALFKKSARILYFPSAGGGATIAGALESLTLSTFGATVGSARAVAAALESLALTTSAARVSSDRAITASVESISITTSPARIASDRAVAAATEQLTVTPATASVALVSGIAAGTEALSVTANPATVALAASIAATLEAITVTGLTATVSTSSNTNISAALESITVTVNPATVSRNTALAAALESLTVTPHAASIAVGQIVAAALESLTLTSYPAGIALDVAIAAQLEQINLTTLAAQVGLGTNVAALTEALTLTPHGATLTFAPSVGAATEYITLTTFAAVVGATEAALLSPGLEFTIPLSRLGYTIPLSRVHFTIPQE